MSLPTSQTVLTFIGFPSDLSGLKKYLQILAMNKLLFWFLLTTILESKVILSTLFFRKTLHLMCHLPFYA